MNNNPFQIEKCIACGKNDCADNSEFCLECKNIYKDGTGVDPDFSAPGGRFQTTAWDEDGTGDNGYFEWEQDRCERAEEAED